MLLLTIVCSDAPYKIDAGITVGFNWCDILKRIPEQAMLGMVPWPPAGKAQMNGHVHANLYI